MDFKIYLSCVQVSDWTAVIQFQLAEDFFCNPVLMKGKLFVSELCKNVKKVVIRGEVQKLGKGDDSA